MTAATIDLDDELGRRAERSASSTAPSAEHEQAPHEQGHRGASGRLGAVAIANASRDRASAEQSARAPDASDRDAAGSTKPSPDREYTNERSQSGRKREAPEEGEQDCGRSHCGGNWLRWRRMPRVLMWTRGYTNRPTEPARRALRSAAAAILVSYWSNPSRAEHSCSRASAGLAAEEIRRRVAEHEWYHVLDLGNGIVTPGQYNLKPLLPHYGLPARSRARPCSTSVRAMGSSRSSSSGGARRSRPPRSRMWSDHDASPALARDVRAGPATSPEAYHHGALGLAIRGAAVAVKRHFCNIYDLTPARVGTYDLVFCASVLLHLTDPLRALYGIRRVCRDEAIICTGIDTHLHVANESAGAVHGHARQGRPSGFRR